MVLTLTEMGAVQGGLGSGRAEVKDSVLDSLSVRCLLTSEERQQRVGGWVGQELREMLCGQCEGWRWRGWVAHWQPLDLG